jgi:hypothetical protein
MRIFAGLNNDTTSRKASVTKYNSGDKNYNNAI